MTKDIVGRLRFTLLRGEDWPPSLHAACDRYEAAVNDEAPIETLKDAKRAFGVEMLALDKWRRPTFYAAPVKSLSPPDGVGLTLETTAEERAAVRRRIDALMTADSLTELAQFTDKLLRDYDTLTAALAAQPEPREEGDGLLHRNP